MSIEREQTECCICMDAINSSINNCTTPCGHSFCFQCLAKALEQTNTCPCCRAVLMESPEEEDQDIWSEYSDDDEHEIFSDEALVSFRLFMARTNGEIGSYDASGTEVSEHDNTNDNEVIVEEEPTEEPVEEPEETEDPIADVESITAKLQGRGITMLDLVAMLTDRKSTKVAKHTDRFINAIDSILDNAIEDCDREAKEVFQNRTRDEPNATEQQKI